MDNILTPAQALPKIRTALERDGGCRLVVTGTSMAPFLRHKKDAVFLIPFSGEANRGDILFYVRPSGACILHRVRRVLNDGTLEITGDAQTKLELVKPEQVLARVSHAERRGKQIACSSLRWRLLSWVWHILFPLRPQLLALAHRLARLK